MRRCALALLLLLALPDRRARAAVYHLELAPAGHGPALVDCERGFAAALVAYFTEFAPREGIVGEGPPRVEVASPGGAISRFVVRFRDRGYDGFVYRDPTMTEAEEEGEEEEGTDPPVCSAVFVSDDATEAERRKLEKALTTVLERLGLPDPGGASPSRTPGQAPRGLKR